MADRQAERARDGVPAQARGEHEAATDDRADDPSRSPGGTESSAPAHARRSARSVAGGLLFAVLLVLALVLAAIVGFTWWDRAHPDRAASRGAVSSTSARDDGLAQAGRLTEQVLSYGWRTLDADARGVAGISTPAFREEYAATMASVRDQTLRNRLRLDATAVGTSVVSARRDQVVALVFVNQETFAPGPAGGRRDQKRVLVTLTRDGGEWRVSAMDAF